MTFSALGHVGITDVIDIIATSVLVYYVLLLIRGTRAVQILIGILVVVGLLGIANLLHLSLLGTVLRLIVVGAAVSIPIVFQPELRRALEQIGRGGLFRMDPADREPGWGRPEDRAIVTLARTASLLGRNRRGALIVIEQQSGLKEYCESGTMLHADISEELLLSIFTPASPLHDGAVVMREGRIEAAGCFLPLAERPLTSPRVGTRHRAALGLSEQTDAVVVVVSEETGAITIARGGKLSRPIDDEQRLVKLLLAITRPPRDERRRRNDVISSLRMRLRSGRGERESHAVH
ncbi:MAG: TIGR00159 family protein [Candidatus Eremiobacteraeota bacterium]|nr:TIGR00159 family protein [Candidatus Eremiobacteraeota bacterium]MBV8497818.1 TIGR00159 family protein [Candidatus Eremiobacteraeota bacterium]